jgi:hypothetical protein
MIKVHKRVVGPKFRPKLFTRHHFPGPLEQNTQDLEGLFTHLHLYPEFSQLAGTQIHCVGAEQSVVRGRHVLSPKDQETGLLTGELGWPIVRLVRMAVKKRANTALQGLEGTGKTLGYQLLSRCS